MRTVSNSVRELWMRTHLLFVGNYFRHVDTGTLVSDLDLHEQSCLLVCCQSHNIR